MKTILHVEVDVDDRVRDIIGYLLATLEGTRRQLVEIMVEERATYEGGKKIEQESVEDTLADIKRVNEALGFDFDLEEVRSI